MVTVISRTFQIGATRLSVSLTPADTLTHLLLGHAGVRAGVVGLETNVQAVLVGVMTHRPHRGVTWSGHGLSPTLTADNRTESPGHRGAVPPGREAAVLVSLPGPDCLISAPAVSNIGDALVPASHIVFIVVAGVAAPGVRQLVPRVPGPRGRR